MQGDLDVLVAILEPRLLRAYIAPLHPPWNLRQIAFGIMNITWSLLEPLNGPSVPARLDIAPPEIYT
jgi:hypothetical protein